MESIAVARPVVVRPAGPACVADPEVMFPLSESQRPGQRTEGELRALAVCAGCPVLVQCRQAVLDTLDSAPMPYGVAGGLTREDRRALRATRRDLTTQPAPVTAAEPATPAALVVVDRLDEQVHAVIAGYPTVASQIDPSVVRALAEARGPGRASRWETALAATVLLERGMSMTAAARLLGEDYTQVKRWRGRRDAGEDLVVAARGTHQLCRPARLVGPQQPARASSASRTRGAA